MRRSRASTSVIRRIHQLTTELAGLTGALEQQRITKDDEALALEVERVAQSIIVPRVTWASLTGEGESLE
jgi:hypothetical protein